MEWTPENVARRDFGVTSRYVAGSGRDFLAAHLNGEPRVLVDFGTWTGRNLPPLLALAGAGGTVIGYDHPNAAPAVATARQTHPTVTFCEGTLTELPFADGEITGALCWRVLHNLKEPHALGRALAEFRRVLRQGAPFLVSVRATGEEHPEPAFVRSHNPTGVVRWDLCFSELACEVVFVRAGFELVHEELVTEVGCSDGEPYANTYRTLHLLRASSVRASAS